jgi:hypothetical protein
MYRRSTKLCRFLFAPKVRTAVCIFYLSLGMSLSAAGSTYDKVDGSEIGEPLAASNAPATYDWNLKQAQRPLLNLPDQIDAAFDLSLAYPMGQFRFPLFQSLQFNERSNRYILLLSAKNGRRGQTIELKEAGAGRYVSTDSSGVYLLDNKGVKTIRASDDTEYTFVRFNDGTTRCIRIKAAEGSITTLVYSKDNLIHGLVDSLGRTIRFNYADHQVASITQTWLANSESVSRTWQVGNDRSEVRLAHASRAPFNFTAVAPAPVTPVAPFTRFTPIDITRLVKPVPNNAVTLEYTLGMVSNDRQLAEIFGGPGAVAAANGFEPDGLSEQYPLYRGDLTGYDGRLIRGHLSYAMHLYGNAEGTGDSALYVPAGFTSHSAEPGPTDAAVTFFYPRLGNLNNVTLAVFHVANFAIERGTGVPPVAHSEDGRLISSANYGAIGSELCRVRIGYIGGPGGSYFAYKHSHIEFYRGDVGLPSASAREHLRIDPATVFAPTAKTATRMRSTTPRRSD